MAPKNLDKKSSKSIIAKSASAKVRTRGPYCHYGTFVEPFSGRTISMSKNFFEYVAQKLGDWIEDLRVNGFAKESSFTMEEFMMQNKIPKVTLFDWRKKSPILNDAYQHAMQCLGVMREVAALYGKMNANVIMRVQHVYSDTWYNAVKSHEELRKPVTVIQSNAQVQQSGVELCASYVGHIEELP